MTDLRKTLSIKSKAPDGSFWAAPSRFQDIETDLLNSVNDVLSKFNNIPVISFEQKNAAAINHRRNSELVQQLSKCLAASFEELQGKMKSPYGAKKLFGEMLEKIQSNLDPACVQKFSEAVNEWHNPKAPLPKVILNY